MELQSLTRIKVLIFESATPISVTVKVVDNCISADELHSRACKAVGLHQSSCKYFSLVQGFHSPRRKYTSGDWISPATDDICLRKWCFDVETERRELFSDGEAVHLLYLEAMHAITTGKLKPSTEQMQKLEEFMDPEFPVEIQYVSLCQQLPHYTSVVMDTCRLCRPFCTAKLKIEKGCLLSMYVTSQGIELREGLHLYSVSWRHIKAWSCNAATSELTLDIQGPHSARITVHLTCPQLPYILSVMAEVIHGIQAKQEEALFFHAGMVQRDNSTHGITHWQNVLFEQGGGSASVAQSEEGFVDLAAL